MKALVTDTHGFDRDALTAANAGRHALTFAAPRLDAATAVLARGYDAVIPFVNDALDAGVLAVLAAGGTRLLALRCAGHNNLDLAAATRLGLRAVNVPFYTPDAVAEHVFALLLSMVRHIPRASARVRDGNFSVDGLVGFGLHGRCFGIVGLGRIGRAVAVIAQGFGCRVLAFDPLAFDSPACTSPAFTSPACTSLAEAVPGIEAVSLEALLARCDVVSLHAPLTPATRHMIDAAALARLRPGAILVNTSRGALVDTAALIDSLRDGRIGGVCLDVYEEEAGVFYRDLSNEILADDVLARLLTFPNVLITSHMGFLTREALREIAATTIASLTAFETGQPLVHALGA
ncbi:MAG: 2-hydroxyacid dehydrogenase [Janthinobacterium lividum]